MRQLVQEKENSEFKPVKLRLKIDLVSYPVRAEGLGKYDIINMHITKNYIVCCLYLMAHQPSRIIFTAKAILVKERFGLVV